MAKRVVRTRLEESTPVVMEESGKSVSTAAAELCYRASLPHVACKEVTFPWK